MRAHFDFSRVHMVKCVGQLFTHISSCQIKNEIDMV